MSGCSDNDLGQGEIHRKINRFTLKNIFYIQVCTCVCKMLKDNCIYFMYMSEESVLINVYLVIHFFIHAL